MVRALSTEFVANTIEEITSMSSAEIESVHRRQAAIQSNMSALARRVAGLPSPLDWATLSLMYKRIQEVVIVFDQCLDCLEAASRPQE
jgi:hypothetical protein